MSYVAVTCSPRSMELQRAKMTLKYKPLSMHVLQLPCLYLQVRAGPLHPARNRPRMHPPLPFPSPPLEKERV